MHFHEFTENVLKQTTALNDIDAGVLEKYAFVSQSFDEQKLEYGSLSQIFLYAFLGWKIYAFGFKFHTGSVNGVQLTIIQDWFRKHLSDSPNRQQANSWATYAECHWCIIMSLGAMCYVFKTEHGSVAINLTLIPKLNLGKRAALAKFQNQFRPGTQ